jgi:photosystem II stability/assembly factor-like uncharacterized protein
MNAFFRCCVAIFLGVTLMTSGTMATSASARGTITETLSLTFLTQSLGWRATDRWNPNTGSRAPLSISRTLDGGVHWQPVAVVAGAGYGKSGSFNVYASRILFADPRDGWLYGNRLYATHDGGLTWRRLPLHGSQTSLSLAGTSVWRLDSSCNARTNRCRFSLLTSAVGSDTWHLMAWRPPRAAILDSFLARADQLHAWLISGPHMEQNHMVLRLLGTEDGGVSWHELPMPCSRNGAGSMYAQLIPYTAASLWIFCVSQPSAGAQAKAVFRSSDGGRRWRSVARSSSFGRSTAADNLTIGGYLNDAAITTAVDAWIALNRGTLVHTIDGGRTWHQAIPINVANPGGGGVGPVQFVDAWHGWLFSFPHLLFRTTDGGRHWQKIQLG